MGFSRFQDRLHSNDTFPFDGFCLVQGIFNPPEPGRELDRILALVLNSNAVAKAKAQPVILLSGSLEMSLYGYLDASGYLLYHI